LKIPEEDQRLLSRYPEFAIVKSIEDAVAYQGWGHRIERPVNFLIARINCHLKKENFR